VQRDRGVSFGVKEVWPEYHRLKAKGVTFRCEPKTAEAPGHARNGTASRTC
jgi:hypothetical protein